MAANRNATQINPPAMRRDSSAVGSKEKLKITTTSKAKKSMELIASFDRHSRRMSLANVARVIRDGGEQLIASPPLASREYGAQSCLPPSTQTRRQRPR